MKSREYERRRRALEEQCHADLNLIRAGYEAKLRALEMIWFTSDGKDEADGAPGRPNPSEAPPSETVSRETVRSEPIPSETVSSRDGPDSGRNAGPQLASGDLLNDLRDALPGLPKVFEKRDLYQALATCRRGPRLYRAIETLKSEQQIVIARHSEGGQRTQYRKVVSPTGLRTRVTALKGRCPNH